MAPTTHVNWWVTRIAVVVAGAVLLYLISWAWTQSLPTSHHADQVLEAQRGGYQTPQHRSCTGLAQMIDGAARAEAAITSRNETDMKLALSSIEDGYHAALNAAGVQPGTPIVPVTSPLNEVRAATKDSHHGLDQPAITSFALDDLTKVTTQISNNLYCEAELNGEAES